MIALIQRVNWAEVTVNAQSIGKIQHGILALMAVEKGDTEASTQKMIDKIINYRIFSDEQGKMNLSLLDMQGELLLVSQFTLLANTDKGRRPSFSDSPDPAMSEALFEYSIGYAKTLVNKVEQGQFAADMKVSLENDGPVTFWLKV
ncbi:D-aminoacyl-tRNA deacylase [Wohlfahrtiimonas larvae]|uniref:D-aminoacyl-tRNA deacylase n=1 Tax=Wohlfahrtiimonas larvae TaxID=1157986 RepID=A0ABP9MGJ8_9GAMM|nr:D-aminoacyl-tRNA deacylase [Wohlfahrtiimonas larvae]